MAAVRATTDKQNQGKVYGEQLEQLQTIRNLMVEQAQASGQWHTQTVKTLSASEQLTNQLRKQKLTFGDLRREMKSYRTQENSALREAIRQQAALNSSMAMQMTASPFGKNSTDAFIPRNLNNDLEMARVKYGYINQMIASAAHQTVNWGKNTQWAGRQITVGLTVPLGMAAVGAAALALEVDKNLTRTAKVYDTMATSQAGQEAELAQLRQAGLDTATRAAGEYGQKMQDVLDIQAQLAATGIQGPDLQQATQEIARISTLGEMEYQKAVDMSIALQSSYKLSTNELTEAFNMMNAVENATSLTIDDIAEAVPRAASALSTLGGTVQEMTVMLVAMREAGVDPGEGANALKSATTRLLNPTRAAVDFFQKEFQVNLPQIVKEANGNIYELMNTLAGLTQGFDELTVQQGVAELFGTYQFNRITALWQNLGIAATTGGNQTAKAMETVNMSAEEMANIADTEMTRWQNSVQGKFRTAVEGIKAALVPLGMTVLEFITPVIDGVASMIRGFNELPGYLKTIILGLTGFFAAVGPFLMLAGIIANLTGNMMKFGTRLANLKYKFSAMTLEERTSAIMAKQAASAFDTQAGAAARLAMSIRGLTEAMEANNLAQGIMPMNADGVIQGANGNQRRIGTRANGSPYYLPGSRKDDGTALRGASLMTPDLAIWKASQDSADKIEDSAKKTGGHMRGWGTALGGIAAGATIFSVMQSGSESTLDTWINIALVVGSIGMMFPGMFSGALDMVKKIGVGIKGLFGGGGGGMKRLWTAFRVGGLNGPLGVFSQIGQMAPKFASFAKVALRVFGPIGILAGGALIIKGMIDDYQALERAQLALAGSAKSWADAIGFTYMPGQLPGQDAPDENSQQARVKLAEDMAEANEDLAEALSNVTDKSRAYNLAMGQALKVVSSGGTEADARKAFAASLEMMDLSEQTIDSLVLKFNGVALDDPDAVRDLLRERLEGVFESTDIDLNLDVDQDDVGLVGSFMNTMRGLFGGDLSSEARALGTEAGSAFGDGLIAAGENMNTQRMLFDQLRDDVNNEFSGIFEDLADDSTLGPILDDLGVRTADELAETMNRISEKINKGKKLTGIEEAFMREMATSETGAQMRDFAAKYEEFLDTLVEGMVASGRISEAEGERLREIISSITGLKIEVTGADVPSQPMLSASKAADLYARALGNAEMHGRTLSEKQKLVMLNSYRARAGLEAAENSAEGFGDAAQAAAGDASALANGLSDVFSAEELADSQRSAMSGAWNDLLTEADRQFSEHQQNVIEGIRRQGELSQDAYEDQADAMQRSFEAREQALDASFERMEASQEAMQERRRNSVEAAWDARINKVQAAIDAEQTAEDTRRRIFEAEQTRIQRAAERFQGSVDLNAALAGGDLDEAARISGDMAARAQSWAVEDADEAAARASEQRIERLNDELDKIETAKDAALEALSKREEAEDAALAARQKRAEESLRIERKNAEDRLNAAKEADRRATESAVASAEAQADADRRGLADRLRALQEFIPTNEQELREHIVNVEAAYRAYGFDLTTQGKGWAGEIGSALDRNVAAAAAALQTQIKWKAIAANIASQVGDGMGMTMAQVVAFLRTGVFPPNKAVTVPPWRPPAPTATRTGSVPGSSIRSTRHSGGGAVPYTGGKSYSQADRVGVPRSSSIYPSEVPTLLRVGEFVMNARATRENREALEAMNKGRNLPKDGHMVRHSGGLMDYTASLFALQQAAAMKVAQAAAIRKIQMEKERQAAMAAAAAATGGMAAGIMGGGNAGSGVFSTSGVWPARVWDQVSPNTAGAVAYIRSKYPQIASIGTLGDRPNTSDHPWGKAADFMIPNWNTSAGIALGDQVARYFIENPNAFGTKYVIWRKRFTEGRGWTNYTHPNGETSNPTLNHYDHPHVSFRHKGGAAGFQLPNLNKGGIVKYDNTLANLHKNEAILTEPLTTSLRENAGNINNGGDKTIIDLRGAHITPEHVQDIDRIIERANEKKDRRSGRKRTVS